VDVVGLRGLGKAVESLPNRLKTSFFVVVGVSFF